MAGRLAARRSSIRQCNCTKNGREPEMSKERTFSIIKPDAVAAGKAGAIMQHLTDGGLKVVATKMIHLSEAQARGFYYVHRERGFFGDLVKFMTSGPCIVQVLEGEN